MPIVTFHLTEAVYPREAVAALHSRASALYAEVRYGRPDGPELERVRTFVVFHRPDLASVAGRPLDSVGCPRPPPRR